MPETPNNQSAADAAASPVCGTPFSDPDRRSESDKMHFRMLALTGAVGKAVSGPDPVEVVLDKCAVALACYLECPLSRIWVLPTDGETMELQAGTGSCLDADSAFGRIALGDGVIGTIAAEKAPRLSNTLGEDPLFSDWNWTAPQGITAFAGTPLTVGDTAIGVIAVFSKTHLPAVTLRFLETVAEQIAMYLDRVRVEKALKKSEQTLKSIIRAAPIGIGLVAKRIFRDVNQELCEMTGYGREELIGSSTAMLYPSQEEFDRVGREKYDQIRRKGSGAVETRWQRKDGAVIDVWLSSAPVDPTNPAGSISSTAVDISDRKKTEQALRDSENRFRSAFELAPGPIAINDTDGRFLRVNRAMCRVFGYAEEELLSTDLMSISHPDDRHIDREHLPLLLTGKASVISYEKRYLQRNGHALQAITNVTLIRTVSGAPLHYVVHILDTSRQKHLEEQLLQAQKMKAVGTLAGGIAHDFNNLMMAIQGRVSLMLMDLTPDHPHTQHLNTVEGHIQSAATLTRELLGFARGGKYEIRSTDLNELIKRHNRMFGRTRKEITIHGLYQPRIWAVAADQGQIRQALMNIYINAWQAMSAGGEIFVQTRNVQVTPGAGYPEDVRPGNYVKIAVTDTGIGMDAQTRQRVFEPFFTTRQLGRGTGMGLASTYGIIKHHGGFIIVDSEKEKGTTFHIYLPATEGTQQAEKNKKTETGGGETLLLVDDEQIILDVGRQLLENIGYNVLVATSGEEALAAYAGCGNRIDLVILDMVMPNMSGEETLLQLKQLDRNVKVIISSGYALDGESNNLMEQGCAAIIQKPFNLAALSGIIREVLAKAISD